MVPSGSVMGGAIMNAPIGSFTTGGAAQAYLLLNLMESIIKDRKEGIRDRLLAEAAENGSATENGSQKLDADGNTVIRERREQHKLKEDKVQELLEKHGVPMEKGFDKVTTWVPSLSKLQQLVENGEIPKDEFDALKDVIWAIKVQASDKFAELLAEAKKNLSPPQLASGSKKSKK